MPNYTHPDPPRLTYRQLLALIEALPEEHKDDNVTIRVITYDEFHPVIGQAIVTEETEDRLDAGHLYLEIA